MLTYKVALGVTGRIASISLGSQNGGSLLSGQTSNQLLCLRYPLNASSTKKFGRTKLIQRGYAMGADDLFQGVFGGEKPKRKSDSASTTGNKDATKGKTVQQTLLEERLAAVGRPSSDRSHPGTSHKLTKQKRLKELEKVNPNQVRIPQPNFPIGNKKHLEFINKWRLHLAKSKLKTVTSPLAPKQVYYGTHWLESVGRVKRCGNSVKKLYHEARAIKRLPVAKALSLLSVLPTRSSTVLRSCLLTARSAACFRGFHPADLHVTRVVIGRQKKLTRVKPHARGKMGRMHHPSATIRVCVAPTPAALRKNNYPKSFINTLYQPMNLYTKTAANHAYFLEQYKNMLKKVEADKAAAGITDASQTTPSSSSSDSSSSTPPPPSGDEKKKKAGWWPFGKSAEQATA